MAKFEILGGKKLNGEIQVSGAKNAALKAFAASLILDGQTSLSRVPQIEDIARMVEIMKDLGALVETLANGQYMVRGQSLQRTQLYPGLHQKLRASVLLVGPALLQKGEVYFTHPGGCLIGKRPIDFFLDGFRALGVSVDDDGEGYRLKARKLVGAKFVFPRISVTGTEALMTFAAKVPGRTELVNCAMEPEVAGLADFLNACGAKISGAGTSTIIIEGAASLRARPFAVMPDRIEAGTFAILGAAAGADIKVSGIVPEHLEVVWELLKKAGVNFSLGADFVELRGPQKLKAIAKDLITHEYPGFPTDLQAPMTVLMTQAQGNSLIFETIYEGRLFYVDVLNSMGADILMCDPHRVLVSGPTKLYGRKIASPDIRAGIALLIAGLIAEGRTEIDNIYQIDRGYEKIEERLQKLGADINRIT